MNSEFTTTIKSEKGFYIGDICYVLSDKIYYGLWENTNFADGSHQVPEAQINFAVASTQNGDGTYYDQFNHEYPVDAGVIGCVPYELLDQEKIIKAYGYLSETKELIKIINQFGYYVQGDSATFYSSGEGEMNITIKANNKTIKSIHINTRYDEE